MPIGELAAESLCGCCDAPITDGTICGRCEFESTAERCEQHGLPIFPWGGCDDCEADYLAHEYAEQQERLLKKWNIVSADEVSDRVKEGGGAELVEGLIAQGSFNLLIGDSSLGKSPLLYQLALCVATGKPFLGFPVKRGDVLIVDYEDGYPDIDTLLATSVDS
jgi:AAA domain